ncbi:histone-lysine N-methyltransferase NSD2-like, partial [Stegodyphus dumicola]|uniref:histone-lysine N-methyltransferase NSD2-like n=1 Tax=Stegodyphus dumicola TaxID=202533 RepID=UPI0015ABA9B8
MVYGRLNVTTDVCSLHHQMPNMPDTDEPFECRELFDSSGALLPDLLQNDVSPNGRRNILSYVILCRNERGHLIVTLIVNAKTFETFALPAGLSIKIRSYSEKAKDNNYFKQEKALNGNCLIILQLHFSPTRLRVVNIVALIRTEEGIEVSKVTKQPSENKKHVANKVHIRSKSKRKTETSEWEDNHCFVCKSPGSLILCDREGCIRAYHIRCLGLNDVPAGDWMCPWHFCSSCSLEAYCFCSNCPISYCRKHVPSGLLIRGRSFRCGNCQRPHEACPSTEPSESPNSLVALVSQSSSAPSLNQYPGELTFKYECDTSCQQKCFRDSANCSGIGRNLSSIFKISKSSENKKHVMNKAPIRRKSKQKIETDDEEDNHCFICKNPGSLLLCDKKGCIRAYHIRCIGMETIPKGDWMCPWHFCSSCPMEAYLFCSNCPVSYCRKHLPSGLMIQRKSFRCDNCKRPHEACPSTEPSESQNSLAALVSQSSSAPSLNQYPGEELAFNSECDRCCQQKSFCGYANCSGIGRNLSSIFKISKSLENKEHVMNKAPIRRKSKRKTETDDGEDNHCFICKNPGSLLLCDKKGCIRAYHIRCIGMETIPE